MELLVVGDLHESWDDVDTAFVEAGRQDAVRAMHEVLGDADLGYGAADVGGFRFVGGRPFSWGGTLHVNAAGVAPQGSERTK